jgi:hypothetical protein
MGSACSKRNPVVDERSWRDLQPPQTPTAALTSSSIESSDDVPETPEPPMVSAANTPMTTGGMHHHQHDHHLNMQLEEGTTPMSTMTTPMPDPFTDVASPSPANTPNTHFSGTVALQSDMDMEGEEEETETANPMAADRADKPTTPPTVTASVGGAKGLAGPTLSADRARKENSLLNSMEAEHVPIAI